MQIADIVKSLVDDGLVDCDKIGGGNFYWALPSKMGQRKKGRVEALQKDLEVAQRIAEKEKACIVNLLADREASHERDCNLGSLTDLTAVHGDLTRKLKFYEDRDPTVLRALGQEVSSQMEHACRWGMNLGSAR
jgi:hypothetical protein